MLDLLPLAYYMLHSRCLPAKLLQLCPTLWHCELQPARLLCPWDCPGKNIGVGCHFFLQGFFPTRGLNPRLPHLQEDSLPLSHQRSPYPGHKYDHMLKVLGCTPSPTSWRPSCVACDLKPFATFLDLLPAFSSCSRWLLWATFRSLNMSRSLAVRSNFRRGLREHWVQTRCPGLKSCFGHFYSMWLQTRFFISLSANEGIPTSRIIVRNEWVETHSTQYVSV